MANVKQIIDQATARDTRYQSHERHESSWEEVERFTDDDVSVIISQDKAAPFPKFSYKILNAVTRDDVSTSRVFFPVPTTVFEGKRKLSTQRANRISTLVEKAEFYVLSIAQQMEEKKIESQIERENRKYGGQHGQNKKIGTHGKQR
jgi:hypothetical protein